MVINFCKTLNSLPEDPHSKLPSLSPEDDKT